jgi:hypothetical protein
LSNRFDVSFSFFQLSSDNVGEVTIEMSWVLAVGFVMRLKYSDVNGIASSNSVLPVMSLTVVLVLFPDAFDCTHNSIPSVWLIRCGMLGDVDRSCLSDMISTARIAGNE